MIGRLKQFIENQEKSVRAFEINIGASDGLIRRAITNDTDIQSKWIGKICEKYPNISLEWLIMGEGEMLLNKETRQPKTIQNNDDMLRSQQATIEKLSAHIEKLQDDLDVERGGRKKSTASSGSTSRTNATLRKTG